MASNAVALVLGAGGNIGHHVGIALAAKGFKVALAARSARQSEDTPDKIHVQSDLSSPESISQLFETVRSRLGQPSVVVYNAAAVTGNDPKNPFSISLEDFQKDLAVNTTSVFAAAKEAVAGFQQLPAGSSPTFIYTGNLLNTRTMAPLMDLGLGKSATAHLIQIASEVLPEKGIKFYYADERLPDGGAPGSKIDGAAHAKHYLDLVEDPAQRYWLQTFVKGVGYKEFPHRL